MLMSRTTRSVSYAAVSLLSVSALAQQTAPTSENLAAPGWQQSSSAPMVRANVDYSYDAGSAAKFLGQRANSEASSVNLGVDSRISLNDDWFVPVGLQSDNYFLGTVAGEPIPNDIHTLHLHTGLGYRLNEQWTFTGLAGPSLYRFNDIHSDDIGAFGGFLATYRVNPAYTWTFGVMISPNNDVPVLPVVGLRWQINDHYTLEVGMPKTRLTYHVDPQWSLYTGLDLNGTTFRTGDSLGAKLSPAQSKYDNALATYRDIRLGVGTGYEIGHGLRAEVEVGYSVYRRIDYKDFNDQVKFDPAPYVRAGLSYRF